MSDNTNPPYPPQPGNGDDQPGAVPPPAPQGDVPPPPPAPQGDVPPPADPAYNMPQQQPVQQGGLPTAPPPPPGGPYAGGSPYGASAPQQQGGKGLAITSLVLSIVGAILCCIPFAVFAGLPLVIVAIILAIVALVKKANGKGMSIAGLIVGGVGAIIGIFVLLATITAIAVLNQLGTELDDYMNENPELFEEDMDLGMVDELDQGVVTL